MANFTTPPGARQPAAPTTVDENTIERGWTDRFARSGEMLAEMARSAHVQDAAGETTELVFPPPG